MASVNAEIAGHPVGDVGGCRFRHGNRRLHAPPTPGPQGDDVHPTRGSFHTGDPSPVRERTGERVLRQLLGHDGIAERDGQRPPYRFVVLVEKQVEGHRRLIRHFP